MSRQTWLPSYRSSMFTRRRMLQSGAAGAASYLLIACGGGGGGGSVLEEAGDPRKPGSVWFSSNDWKLPDEGKEAVRGGIYRGFMDEDQAGHYDPLALPPSQQPHSDHVNEFLMGRNRGPGVDPRSAEGGV